MNTILTQKFGGGWRAVLAGTLSVWEAGTTEEEAIGKLVRSFPHRFGVTIQSPEINGEYCWAHTPGGWTCAICRESGKIDAEEARKQAEDDWSGGFGEQAYQDSLM